MGLRCCMIVIPYGPVLNIYLKVCCRISILGGVTCAPVIAEAVERVCRNAEGYSSVSNGRFKGGWTTRHYGRPAEGWHAIQMELAQSTYMEEAAPWPYLHDRADRLRVHLKEILTAIDAIARNGELT